MKFIDEKLLKFGLVGILNTIVGYLINFVALNVFQFGYWVSVLLNYIPTSILSFVLNKYFTFKSKGNIKKEAFRFAINIIICMTLAYGIAKPGVAFLMGFAGDGMFSFVEKITFGFLSGKEQIVDNVATIVGMVLFVVFNYTGQRFFAFKDEE